MAYYIEIHMITYSITSVRLYAFLYLFCSIKLLVCGLTEWCLIKGFNDYQVAEKFTSSSFLIETSVFFPLHLLLIFSRFSDKCCIPLKFIMFLGFPRKFPTVVGGLYTVFTKYFLCNLQILYVVSLRWDCICICAPLSYGFYSVFVFLNVFLYPQVSIQVDLVLCWSVAYILLCNCFFFNLSWMMVWFCTQISVCVCLWHMITSLKYKQLLIRTAKSGRLANGNKTNWTDMYS